MRLCWMLVPVALFGCTSRAVDEGNEAEERHELECDIAVLCGEVVSEDGCAQPQEPDPCFVLHRDKLAECIDELGERRDAMQSAAPEAREALCLVPLPVVCGEVYTLSFAPECFGQTT